MALPTRTRQLKNIILIRFVIPKTLTNGSVVSLYLFTQILGFTQKEHNPIKELFQTKNC